MPHRILLYYIRRGSRPGRPQYYAVAGHVYRRTRALSSVLSFSFSFLSIQRVSSSVLRYLVVEVLDRLGASRILCRDRPRRRVRIAADRRQRVVLRLHVDDADAERGTAVVVARRVRRLVDRYHVAINDL